MKTKNNNNRVGLLNNKTNYSMKERLIKKDIILFFIAIFSSVLMMAQTTATQKRQTLQYSFKMPPDSIKPSVYWYWMSDNISEQGVKKDIEAMVKVGIGRAFIGNIGYAKEEVPYGKIKLFSDEWWKITKTAITTATKKGLDIGMFNSPGWSQSGGPWIKPAQSMRYLSGNEIKVKGPLQLNQKLTSENPDFQSVAVLAFPALANEADAISLHAPKIISSLTFDNLPKLLDGDFSGGANATSLINDKTVATIDIEVADNFIARSLVLYPLEKPLRVDVELQIKEGNIYRTIKKFVFDRTNPDKNVGYIPYAPVAVSFPAVTGKQFRLVLSNMNNAAGFAEIKLSPTPVVERFEEKQLAKMLQTPFPLWAEYQWQKQEEPDDKSLIVDPTNVIDITKYLSVDGILHWAVPAGNWIIMHYGMLPTGVTNSPASPEGRGLEIDKINKAAMQHHFDSFVGKIQNSIPVADRKSLKWLVADSYETGSQNWTDGMREIFSKQYGYDPLPWLPVLSGRVIGSEDKSDRFLWDLRRLVADRVAYEYVGGLRNVAHQHGLKLWLENYGHWGYPSEFLKYGGQSDEVSGEFWNEGELGNIECRSASSAAHIYGKTKVSAESFTAGGLAYARYPAMLKKRGDWSFTEGINNTLLHVFIEQPYEEVNPGVNAGFGTEFNRKNTWFYQGKAFIDYIRRCNFLLQQGKPVNDVAYFISEDAPKMTGIRDPELPAGYSYDYINAEVLMERVIVKNGNLVLPDGMQYRMLVLPKLETMRPELLKKIGQLIKQGITILGPAPKRSPSLQNYPVADEAVQKLAMEIWGSAENNIATHLKYGAGNVLTFKSIQEALDFIKVIPDVLLPDKNVLYAHRTTKDQEIYFLTNQTDQIVSISPAFRVVGKQAAWWDAVSGETRSLNEFTTQIQTTTIPIKLAPYESGFVIFKNEPSLTKQGYSSINFPEATVIATINTPWLVKFDTASRGPLKPVLFKTLSDWSLSADAAIKNYAGTAIYTTNFKVNKLLVENRYYLNLGMVKVMAKVKVNGKDIGSVWTAPYKIDVTNAIKKGENTIEIEVVNTWVNRLIGDSKLPEAERKTWSNVNIYTPDSKYEPSGLLGPVTLEAVKY